jgi:hypothetical protein
MMCSYMYWSLEQLPSSCGSVVLRLAPQIVLHYVILQYTVIN